MGSSIFKGVEIVGTSEQSFNQAIEAAVSRARKTLHNLSWFVVEEMRGGLQQGQLQYQVTLRVFFKLDDTDDAAETNADSGREAKAGARAAGQKAKKGVAARGPSSRR